MSTNSTMVFNGWILNFWMTTFCVLGFNIWTFEWKHLNISPFEHLNENIVCFGAISLGFTIRAGPLPWMFIMFISRRLPPDENNNNKMMREFCSRSAMFFVFLFFSVCFVLKDKRCWIGPVNPVTLFILWCPFPLSLSLKMASFITRFSPKVIQYFSRLNIIIRFYF